MTPLCIDLYAGLGGWTEGFLAEGYDVIGFDVEQHVYGEHRYPAQLVLQDVRTIYGKQFKDAAIIVASSPCQEFSYRAMPWKRAKQLPPPHLGMELFAQAARIQREAIEAAGGRYIPMIQENVRGAQKWVGRARWHYGSYYLWGDVPALMPITSRRKNTGGSWFTDGNGSTVVRNDPRYEGAGRAKDDSTKVGGLDWNKRIPGQAFNTHAERATKNDGGSWFNVANNTTSGHGQNPVHALAAGEKVGDRNAHRASGGALKSARFTNPDEQPTPSDGVKQGGDWFNDPKSMSRQSGSKSLARKAASARIAKIPFPLANYIARTYDPRAVEADR